MSEEPRHRLALIGPMYPYRGGIAHFTETMAHGLAARGHEVDAITFSRQYPSLLFPGKTQYETDRPDPIQAPRLLDSINPWTWRQSGNRVISQQADFLVFNHWMPFFGPAFGTIARRARRHGVRSLAVVHNAIPHEKRPGDAALSRYFFHACDGFVVLSASVAEDLRSLGVTAPIRQVAHPTYTLFGDPMPKEEARSQLGLDPEAPTLLFFGFIRKYKGLHVLLKALPSVVDRLPKIKLIVAGEFYDDEAPYRDLVAQHGLEAHVDFHADYIPDGAVARYFSAADVVVQPYVTATQSGVAQIAYHFDTPAIITDVGGLAEIVPHERAGLVVPPENPEALAAAILRYVEEDMQDVLTEGVRQEKHHYSWDRLYEALETLM